MAIIYAITNKITSKQYVGQTQGTLEDRWKRHQHDALRKNSQFHLHCSMRKHGVEVFVVSVLETCDVTVLYDREEFWIDKLSSFINGYNMTAGGDGVAGFRHTVKSREKMSSSHLGKRLPQEIKSKISIANKGRIKTLEHCERLRVSNVGKHDHQGEKHPRATLTDEQVKEILRIWNEEKLVHASNSRMINVRDQLCEKFGITRGVLNPIVLGKTWQHLRSTSTS